MRRPPRDTLFPSTTLFRSELAFKGNNLLDTHTHTHTHTHTNTHTHTSPTAYTCHVYMYSIYYIYPVLTTVLKQIDIKQVWKISSRHMSHLAIYPKIVT